MIKQIFLKSLQAVISMKKHVLRRPVARIMMLLGGVILAVNCMANTLNSQVDRLDIGLNETFNLTVTYSAQVFSGSPDFTPLRKDFEIISTAKTSQYNSINGQVESYTRWQIVLMPRKAGKLTIPSLTFKGEKSQAITVMVNNAPANTGKFDGSQNIYLETDIDKQSVFVQEQVLLTLRLYTNTSLSNIEPEDLKLDNASSELVNESQFQRNINGTPYVIVERTYAIFPQNSGTLEIPSMRWDLQLGSRAQSLFDRLDNRQLRRLRTEAKSIDVKPAPSTYPASKDWLPANKLSLRQEWSAAPSNFKVGEPITRTLIIEAEGISAAQIPQIESSAPNSLNIYPEPPKADENKSAKGLVTTIRQTQAIVPTKAGEFELPEIKLPWWNTKTQSLETATLPAQKIFVYSSSANLNTPTTTESPLMAEAPAVSTPGTAQEPGNEGNILIWQMAALIFGALSVILSALCLRLWLSKPATIYHQDRARSDDAPRVTEKQTLNQLKRLSKQNQVTAEEARKALLAWAFAHWPNNPPSGLHQIGSRFSENKALANELQALNQSLYGGTEANWSLSTIYTLLNNSIESEYRQTKGKSDAQLKPLYSE